MLTDRNENLSHCRFCGESEKVENLLDLSVDRNILEDCINKFAFLKIDFVDFNCSSLPKTACESCLQLTNQCYGFIHKIKQTQKDLMKIYKHSNNSMEIDIKIEIDDLNPDTEFSVDFNKNKDSFKEDLHKTTNFTRHSRKCHKKSLISKRRNECGHFKHKIRQKKKKIETENSKIKSMVTTAYETAKLRDNLVFDSKNTDCKVESSWKFYDWSCMHCQTKFNSVTEVREHSKAIHTICFALKCSDCAELFNYFNPFVEHVREHREFLRLYCQFCDAKFSTYSEVVNHSANHWSSGHICSFCGEILPNKMALERHRKVYKKAALPQRCYKKKPRSIPGNISWQEYQWICQDCNLPLVSAGALRAHARSVHAKCFAMRCADCLAVMNNFKHFVEHASAHRDSLKNFCPYCNAYLSQMDKDDHISTHTEGPQKPCLGCGELFPDSVSLTQHKTRYDTPKVRGPTDAESLTCGVCCKMFQNRFQLKNHKVIHNENRDRDQICHTCGKAFYDVKTLTNHIKTHFTKTETCQICKKTFLTKQRLKVHISTHLEIKHFVCNDCGKKFRRKSQLRLHLASHSNVLPFQCGTCGKSFRMQSYLKIHERQHTGIRPYSCEVCKETFNHWGNCNRHMLRKHGVSFAKTKITAHGKLDINKETGETNDIELGSNVREWCDEMLKPNKRGRKKKV